MWNEDPPERHLRRLHRWTQGKAHQILQYIFNSMLGLPLVSKIIPSLERSEGINVFSLRLETSFQYLGWNLSLRRKERDSQGWNLYYTKDSIPNMSSTSKHNGRWPQNLILDCVWKWKKKGRDPGYVSFSLPGSLPNNQATVGRISKIEEIRDPTVSWLIFLSSRFSSCLLVFYFLFRNTKTKRKRIEERRKKGGHGKRSVKNAFFVSSFFHVQSRKHTKDTAKLN